MHSLKAQQFRWTKGAQETARKMLPRLWRSDVAASVKWQGTMHLLSSLAYPLLIILTLLSPFVVPAAGRAPSQDHLADLPVLPAGVLRHVPLLLHGGACARRIVATAHRAVPALSRAVDWDECAQRARSARRLVGQAQPVRANSQVSRDVIPGVRPSRGRYRSRASWSRAWRSSALSACSFVGVGLAIHLRQFGAVPSRCCSAAGTAWSGVYSLSHLRFASPTLRLTSKGLRQPTRLAAPTAA